jgi:hypothetical protein
VLLRGALAHTQSLTARLYEAWRADQFVLLITLFMGCSLLVMMRGWWMRGR